MVSIKFHIQLITLRKILAFYFETIVFTKFLANLAGLELYFKHLSQH